ncbi:YpiF family protein [Bacillus spongiae]|uniref:YpiF family protein n=2 Tax=Bacillus spongiae TaxID=2683610 RepID=A0ABU8HCY0_9BACI
MNWNVADIEQYINEQEYIDTVVIPLVPITFGQGMKNNASQMEFINILTQQLERQFKGRLLLLPNFTYVEEVDKLTNKEMLQTFVSHLKALPLKHVLYVTSDKVWKSYENELEGECIWIPAIPLDNMDDQYKRSIMEDQVKQLLNIFIQKWQNR